MPLAKFSVVNFDFAEVMGGTCNKVVKRMSKINFHDAAAEAPPGHSVDFGHDDCKHDDKGYEHLPSARHAAEVTEESHRLAMVRFFFLLAACLNMTDQAACALFDVNKVKEILVQHKNKPRSLLPPNTPVVSNPSVHLAFNEISLLLGGHCMLSTDLSIATQHPSDLPQGW
jgi:hypothetical protein